MQMTVRTSPAPGEETAPGHALGTEAAAEDYLKAIYSLEQRGDESVTTTRLAQRLEVTLPAASAMAKRLAERGLASHEPYRGVTLTEPGRRLALEVMRHHRLIETFLADELGMPWDRVHAEADVLEHVISEELEGLIASKLGNPRRDPHGDPIPSAELEIVEDDLSSLAEVEVGSRGVFVRVSDSDPGMLRYLAERGIAPGDRLEVVERQPFGGPVFARIGSEVHPLGGELATAIRVELEDGGK
ncbi:MAG: metal-dependent transcriptional regulator [Solirubrobacterales bacterium]